jgi:hypothetical protein
VSVREQGGPLATAGPSRKIASVSSGVTLPGPKLAPALEAAPGLKFRTLAPIAEKVFWIAAEEPAPISIMAMAASTPMTIPTEEGLIDRSALDGMVHEQAREAFTSNDSTG